MEICQSVRKANHLPAIELVDRAGARVGLRTDSESEAEGNQAQKKQVVAKDIAEIVEKLIRIPVSRPEDERPQHCLPNGSQ